MAPIHITPSDPPNVGEPGVPDHLRASDPSDLSDLAVSEALRRYVEVLIAVGGRPLGEATREAYARFGAKDSDTRLGSGLDPRLLRNVVITVATWMGPEELSSLEELLEEKAKAALGL